MKYIIYGLLFIQAIIILALLTIMNSRHFSISDMGQSFRHGCEIGQSSITYKTFTCKGAASTMEETLRYLDGST